MYYQRTLPSPIGPLLLRSDGTALTGLQIGVKADDQGEALSLFSGVEAWLDLYFSGQDPGPVPVPLLPQGTAFQKKIWDLLLEIPYGSSRTYGELAGQLSARMSPQAVGAAIGRNPIAILIPCHRVLGASGALTGYAWGLEAKKHLLTLEGIPYTEKPLR